jgi:hypothetical protein
VKSKSNFFITPRNIEAARLQLVFHEMGRGAVSVVIAHLHVARDGIFFYNDLGNRMKWFENLIPRSRPAMLQFDSAPVSAEPGNINPFARCSVCGPLQHKDLVYGSNLRADDDGQDQAGLNSTWSGGGSDKAGNVNPENLQAEQESVNSLPAQVPVAYDKLPKLSRISKFSAAGCSFCAFLLELLRYDEIAYALDEICDLKIKQSKSGPMQIVLAAEHHLNLTKPIERDTERASDDPDWRHRLGYMQLNVSIVPAEGDSKSTNHMAPQDHRRDLDIVCDSGPASKHDLLLNRSNQSYIDLHASFHQLRTMTTRIRRCSIERACLLLRSSDERARMDHLCSLQMLQQYRGRSPTLQGY